MEAKSTERFRKLRIAWSVVLGIVAVLLCALWVRSCYVMDQIYAPTSSASHFYFGSKLGQLQLAASPIPAPGNHRFLFFSMPIADLLSDEVTADEVANDPLLAEISALSPIGRRFHLSVRGFIAPYWFLLIVSGCLPAAPCFSFTRFSLRTLLIATTPVAVVLGVLALSH